MAARVLSTETAKQSIKSMQGIITGPLLEDIRRLNDEGQRLMDPEVWDGPLARKFRGDWPQIHTTLQRAQQQLEELRANIAAINENIMVAGGN